MAIRAILFDMDGVLIDAREWHYKALNRALKLFGFAITRYQHLVAYDGLPTRKKLEMLTIERGLPVGLHGFINEMKQRYTIDLIHRNCHPVFQHEYALSRLKAEGLKLVVGSNSIRQSMELMLAEANLVKYLDFFLSNEDVRHPKPNPEIYTLAINRLGLTPEECLVVEDNPNGVAAAKASGAHVMVVSTPQDVHYEAVMRHIRSHASGAAS